MPRNNILGLLRGGDRTTIGGGDEVAEIVSNERRRFPKLIAGLWSAEPLMHIRAADAKRKGYAQTSRTPREIEEGAPRSNERGPKSQSYVDIWLLSFPRLPLEAREC